MKLSRQEETSGSFVPNVVNKLFLNKKSLLLQLNMQALFLYILLFGFFKDSTIPFV